METNNQKTKQKNELLKNLKELKKGVLNLRDTVPASETPFIEYITGVETSINCIIKLLPQVEDISNDLYKSITSVIVIASSLVEASWHENVIKELELYIQVINENHDKPENHELIASQHYKVYLAFCLELTTISQRNTNLRIELN